MRWRNSYRWQKNFLLHSAQRTGLLNLSRHSAIATILSAVMTLGLRRRCEDRCRTKLAYCRRADQCSSYCFFLSIAISLPEIVLRSSSKLLSQLDPVRGIFGKIAFLVTIYAVVQSFKLALYKIRLSFSQTSLTEALHSYF